MITLTYAQIEAAAKEGPEAVAVLLYAAGAELSGLPKELRRKLRGEPAEAPAADAPPAKDPPPAPTGPGPRGREKVTPLP
jgi:hypothetical protein